MLPQPHPHPPSQVSESFAMMFVVDSAQHSARTQNHNHRIGFAGWGTDGFRPQRSPDAQHAVTRPLNTKLPPHKGETTASHEMHLGSEALDRARPSVIFVASRANPGRRGSRPPPQAMVLYEEQITDSKLQMQILTAIIATIQRSRPSVRMEEERGGGVGSFGWLGTAWVSPGALGGFNGNLQANRRARSRVRRWCRRWWSWSSAADLFARGSHVSCFSIPCASNPLAKVFPLIHIPPPPTPPSASRRCRTPTTTP